MGIIKKVFPGWHLSRIRAMAMADNIERAYEAAQASTYRRMGKSSDPITATDQGTEKLRDQARYLDENHDLTIGILDSLVNQVVGGGVPLLPLARKTDGSLATELNAQIKAAWKDWARRPTACRTMHLNEALRLMCRAWLRDGEVLSQRIRGTTNRITHAGAVPYTLELIEADSLPIGFNSRAPQIVQGIEVNNWRQPIAYHLLKYIPGSQQNNFIFPNAQNTKRVAANDIFHLIFTRRIGQLRGVSILHGVLNRMSDVKDYEQSELIAARIAASFTGYIKHGAGGSSPFADEGGVDIEAGMIFDNLAPGSELKMVDSAQRPNPELGNFRHDMLRAVACGTGTNASTITKRYDGTYSSQRQELVESKPNFERMRDYFIELFLLPVYEDFLEMALLTRAVRLTPDIDRDTIRNVSIRGLVMPWIDPKKELEAEQIALDQGLKARQQIIIERGGDPEQVDEMIAADTFEPVARTQQGNPAPAPEAPGANNED